MKQIQKWFERIAGLTQEERDRYATAREIFGNAGPDTHALALPACWRRKCRVQNRSR